MEKREIKLKATKENALAKFFNDRSKRYIIMAVLILPFLIAIGIFAAIALREVNTLKSLATGSTETKQENLVENMGYILRDNATDYQKDLFKELKEAFEGEQPADDITLAGLVAKNYIADFYTFSNKQGQYDVGGLYFVYNGEFENGNHFKDNVYLAARDGYYKYLNNYMSQYGAENLPTVKDIEITKCVKAPWKYVVSEHVANKQDENGEWYDYREIHDYDAYIVNCKWTYEESTMNLAQFANSVNLLVINHSGPYVIVEASDGEIKERKIEEKDENSQSDEEEDVESTEDIDSEEETESSEDTNR